MTRIIALSEALPSKALVRPASRIGRGKLAASLGSVLRHAALILGGLIMLYPLFWLIVASLRPSDEIFRDPGLAISHVSLDNYRTGWDALGSPFSTFLLNSSIVVVGCVLGNIVACSITAYAFARLDFVGRKFWFVVMLCSIMLPFHVLVVPQYIMFSQLGWVNTFLPLIVPKILATDAFFVFLMVQFIRSIPRELDEAATIDGAGHIRIFSRLIFPLMTPAIGTTAVFTFIWTWNDFFSQLIYLTKPAVQTVPIALRGFQDSSGASNWGPMFAMSLISLIPVLLVFIFGQRALTQGIAATGGK